MAGLGQDDVIAEVAHLHTPSQQVLGPYLVVLDSTSRIGSIDLQAEQQGPVPM